ncbi:iron-sulfur cluster assembly accessory protein [Candidatus Jorgensenbacteria bacterium]|nr:iron-sulfur cluster assembly accessory protein [Candidatus Jorgensenbacteria bacterium]
MEEREVETQAGIVLTEKAAEQLRAIMIEHVIPEMHALRIGIKGGGCSGFSYVFGFDAAPRVGDVIFESQELKIFVDERSLEFLKGTTIDFHSDVNGRGFVFKNPNATKSCGCGKSFSA